MSFDSSYPAQMRWAYRRPLRSKARTTQWFRHKLGLLAIKMVTYNDEMLDMDAGAAPVMSPRLREALRQLNYLAQEPAE
jgi:hypothetical protein